MWRFSVPELVNQWHPHPLLIISSSRQATQMEGTTYKPTCKESHILSTKHRANLVIAKKINGLQTLSAAAPHLGIALVSLLSTSFFTTILNGNTMSTVETGLKVTLFTALRSFFYSCIKTHHPAPKDSAQHLTKHFPRIFCIINQDILHWSSSFLLLLSKRPRMYY